MAIWTSSTSGSLSTVFLCNEDNDHLSLCHTKSHHHGANVGMTNYGFTFDGVGYRGGSSVIVLSSNTNSYEDQTLPLKTVSSLEILQSIDDDVQYGNSFNEENAIGDGRVNRVTINVNNSITEMDYDDECQCHKEKPSDNMGKITLKNPSAAYHYHEEFFGKPLIQTTNNDTYQTLDRRTNQQIVNTNTNTTIVANKDGCLEFNRSFRCNKTLGSIAKVNHVLNTKLEACDKIQWDRIRANMFKKITQL